MGPEQNPLDPNSVDLGLTYGRALVALLGGPVGSLIGELTPSATDRQHARAIRTLQCLVEELSEQVSADMWKEAQAREGIDSAYVRAERAALEAAEEEKRELIWYGLINGCRKNRVARPPR